MDQEEIAGITPEMGGYILIDFSPFALLAEIGYFCEQLRNETPDEKLEASPLSLFYPLLNPGRLLVTPDPLFFLDFAEAESYTWEVVWK